MAEGLTINPIHSIKHASVWTVRFRVSSCRKPSWSQETISCTPFGTYGSIPQRVHRSNSHGDVADRTECKSA